MKNKNFIFSIVLFLSIFIILVSCGKQKAEWKGTIEEIDGVTVVKNPKEPIYNEDVFNIDEDLTIGQIGGEEEYMFQEISHLAMDDEENIYVSDSRAAQVKVFDKNGKYLRTIGKKGQGPGEMMTPTIIQVLPQKELLVKDLEQTRIHFFKLDGKFLRHITTRSRRWLVGPKADSKGHMVVEYGYFRDENKSVVKKVDFELNPVLEIASVPISSRPPNLIHYFEWRHGFVIWDVSKEDNIIWGNITKYEIYIYNPEGKLIKKFVRDYEGGEVTKAEKERLWKEWYGDIPIPPQMRLEFPRYFPPFKNFSCDEEGRIYVQTYERTEDEERDYYDVFNSEGKYIARISLKYRPLVWKNNKLYTIEEDEDGFQIVKRYKVTWKI